MVKKIARIVAFVILGILLLNGLLIALFSVPAVQKKGADIALRKIREFTGTRVSLQGIRVRPFHVVELDGLYVEDLQHDTLLCVGKMGLHLRTRDLFKKKITVRGLNVENFTANIYKNSPEEPFNFQFIADALGGGKDTTDVQKQGVLPPISVRNIRFKNGQLHYHLLSQPMTPGKLNINHLDIRNFNLEGKAEVRSPDDITASVEVLRFEEENSGLVLRNLKGRVKEEGAVVSSEGLTLALNQSELNLKKLHYDLKTSDFNIRFELPQVDMRDLSVITPNTAHLDQPMSLSVEAKGQLPQATLDELSLRYGDETQIDISGWVGNCYDIEKSDLDIDIHRLKVSREHLQDFIRIVAADFISPEEMWALGNLDLTMSAKGKIGYFRYDGNIVTEQGDLFLNGVGKMTDQFRNLLFEGAVRAEDIHVAGIIGEDPGVGNATIEASAKVSILADSAVTVNATGNVASLYFRKYHYRNLHFDAEYRGDNVRANVKSQTHQNHFDLFADITFGENLRLDVKGAVNRLDLKPYLMMEGWKDPSLSFRINSDLSGASFDEMTGLLVLENLSLSDSNFIYNPGNIYLQASADSGKGKKLQFISSFLEADVNGNYSFSSIVNELTHLLHTHLPSAVLSPKETDDRAEMSENDFDFQLLLKNTEDLSYAFSLPFYNVDPATINGTVRMAKEVPLTVDAQIPRLMFGKNDIRETRLKMQAGRTSGVGMELNSYLVQEKGYVNLRLNSSAAFDSLNNRLAFEVNRPDIHSKGIFFVDVGFQHRSNVIPMTRIHFHPTEILFNGKQVQFNDASVALGKDRIDISNFGIRENEHLLLGISGVASKSEADHVRIYFDNTELSNILAAFNVANFGGAVKGDIYIHQALENPLIRTEQLRVENITVYDDTIGDLRIEGNWDNLYSGMKLKASLISGNERNLNIHGHIPTGDNSPLPMDMSFQLSNFNLSSVRPLATGIFSDLTGRLNAHIRITGKLSEPVAEGWIGIDQGILRVAYTNVTYHVSDTIRINRDNVGLQNLVIRDQNNHIATLNVTLSHSNFGRLAYHAGLQLDDFMLLNNKERNDLMIYGDLKLSGNIDVVGSSSGIFGEGKLATTSKSEVTVMLPQTARATEYSGVVYINTKQKSDSLSFLRKNPEAVEQFNVNVSKGIPVSLKAAVDLNPLLDVGVVLDPTTGNALQVNGEGELNVIFNSKSTPPVRLYGDYMLHSGKFHYNLQNLRAINFNIRDGSRLTMEGDPMNTQFDLTAYLPVKVDLATLSPSFTSEMANTRVPVNALLQVRGDLRTMDLKYEIELPESSNDIRQRVSSFINNEETRILQFAYLTTTGSFIPAEGSPNMNFGSSTFTRFAANTLSRGLDALFARALKDNWSVSTNLESVDGSLENVRMGVDVSTRLLNDRLRISTNLSYGDKSMLAGQQAFMGEFELEYDINNWMMIRAFNRANERFYRRTPTTQGVGVMVRKEGKTFRELFDFRNIRKKVEK